MPGVHNSIPFRKSPATCLSAEAGFYVASGEVERRRRMGGVVFLFSPQTCAGGFFSTQSHTPILLPYSLLLTPRFLLLTSYFLLLAPYSLLLTSYSLLLTPYFLLLASYSLLLTPYFLLLTPCSLLLTPYSLLLASPSLLLASYSLLPFFLSLFNLLMLFCP